MRTLEKKSGRGLILGVVAGGMLLASLPLAARASSAFTESKRVVVSTTMASPTQISAAGNYQRTSLTNSTTYWCLFGDSRTAFSTSASTGTARVINSTFTPDGPKEPYQGAIFGVCENVAAIVDCIRIK